MPMSEDTHADTSVATPAIDSAAVARETIKSHHMMCVSLKWLMNKLCAMPFLYTCSVTKTLTDSPFTA